MTVRTATIDQVPGEPLEIPYVELRGAKEGPHLTVVAGVHGTEYTSMAAVRELARTLDPATLSGTVTAVPILNLPAFWARSPFVVPADGKNLNRCFPGDPEGSYSDVLAHQLFHRFIADTDYLLDLHAGDIPESLEPFTIYDESPVEQAARDLAFVYGVDHVVRQSASGRTVGGSTCASAADAGVPAIIAEAGQNGLLERAAVETHLTGLGNVLAHLGMTATQVGARPTPEEHPGWHWLRTPVAGWWEPAVTPGEAVGKDAPLGYVSDIAGNHLYEAKAPEAGTPLFITSSPAVGPDGLLMGLAKEAA